MGEQNFIEKKENLKKKDLSCFKKKHFLSSRNNQRGKATSLLIFKYLLQYYEPIMYKMASETGNMKITSTSVMSYHYTIYHYISP